MKPKKTTLAESMPARVRTRREAKGISGADLSRRIGVSPAYVSQIEKGIRVPDIPVAVRIAHTLEDDEALYVAWCRDHKARLAEQEPEHGRRRRLDAPLPGRPLRGRRPVQPGGAERRGHPARAREERRGPFDAGGVTPREERAALRFGPRNRRAPWSGSSTSLSASARREGRSLVTAPVLEPGKDPGERDEVPRQLWVDTMVIDPRFLPDARLGRPFVFRADEEVSRRVRDRVAPGRPGHRLARPGRRGAGAGQGVRDAEGRPDLPGEAHELRREVPRPAGARGERDGRPRARGGEAGEAGAGGGGGGGDQGGLRDGGGCGRAAVTGIECARRAAILGNQTEVDCRGAGEGQGGEGARGVGVGGYPNNGSGCLLATSRSFSAASDGSRALDSQA